jgi:hypothetical protein
VVISYTIDALVADAEMEEAPATMSRTGQQHHALGERRAQRRPLRNCRRVAGPAVLPAAGLYKPIQDYDRQTLAKDLTAHLVYGISTAGALRLLSPLTKHPRHGRVRGASTGVSFP